MNRHAHLDDHAFIVPVASTFLLVMALNAVVFTGSLAKGWSLEILNPTALLWIQHWPGRGIV